MVRLETMVQPDILMVLSSAEDGGEDMKEGWDTESNDMDTQEPQTAEGLWLLGNAD